MLRTYDVLYMCVYIYIYIYRNPVIKTSPIFMLMPSLASHELRSAAPCGSALQQILNRRVLQEQPTPQKGCTDALCKLPGIVYLQSLYRSGRCNAM